MCAFTFATVTFISLPWGVQGPSSITQIQTLGLKEPRAVVNGVILSPEFLQGQVGHRNPFQLRWWLAGDM